MEYFRAVQSWQIRVIGFFILVIILAAVANIIQGRSDKTYHAPPYPGGFTMPIIALELVNSPDDIKEIVGDRGDPRRDKTSASQWADDRFIIPIYWLLFVALSWLLAHRRFSYAMALGLFAGLCVTVAAVFDYMENAAIRVALNTAYADTTQEMAKRIQTASLWKWGLLFVSLGLLSTLFFRRRDWFIIIGLFLLAGALTGIVGLFHHPAIEWAYLPMAAGLILTALTFSFIPAKVLRSH